MPGRVLFEYDENLNIVFTEDHWEIKTKQDVDEFFAEYQRYFQKLAKKVYMVSNIDDLLVHAEVADYYGEAVTREEAIKAIEKQKENQSV